MQAYALQKVILAMGHEVSTVNIRRRPASFFGKVKYIIVSIIKKVIFRRKTRLFKLWVTKKQQAAIDFYTNQFVNEHLALTRQIRNKKDLVNLNNEYDCFIVGSDQVWRKQYLRKELMSYYFDFLSPNKTRFSYAASFGKSEMDYSKSEIRQCRDLLRLFNKVSVRETDGIKLCEKYFNCEAVQVLDPTLLLNDDQYDELIQSDAINENLPKSKYILAYILNPSSKSNELIAKYAESIGAKPYYIMPSIYGETSNDIQKCIYPSISTWLSAFKNAEYIITDSFHGSVFSMIYHKQFFVFDNPSRGSSRLKSLLNTFEIDNRFISYNNGIEQCLNTNTIDYLKVDEKLDKLRNDSHQFLNTALGLN